MTCICVVVLWRVADGAAPGIGAGQRLRAVGLALLVADVAYAVRQPCTPRYPYNYLPDGAYLVAAALLVRALHRPLPRTPLRRAAVLSTALVLLAVQGHFILLPMHKLADKTSVGVALATLYGACTGWSATQLLRVLPRLRRRQAVVGSHGVALMLAADGICRHAALAARHSAEQLGESLWLAGLALVAGAGLWPRRHSAPLPWPLAIVAPAPWRSLRVASGLALTAMAVLTLTGLVITGWLQIDSGRRLATLMCMALAASLAANLAAIEVAGWLRQWLRALAHYRQFSRLTARAAHDLRGPVSLLLAAANTGTDTGPDADPRFGARRGGALTRDAGRRIAVLADHIAHLHRRIARRPDWAPADPRAASAAPAARAGGRPAAVAQVCVASRGGAFVTAVNTRRQVACVAFCRQALQEAQARHPYRIGTQVALALQLGDGAIFCTDALLSRRRLHLSYGWETLTYPLARTAVSVALAHLLDNAVQAVPANGGKVGIRLVLGRRCLRIAVYDNGVGLRQGELARLGHGPVVSRKIGGSGLGVWRVATLARRMGAKLSCRSRVGKGTAWSLSLPMGPPGRLPRRSLVVLVDDDPLVRRAWRMTISKNFRVAAFASADSCLAWLAAHWPRKMGQLATTAVLPRSRTAPQPFFFVDDNLGEAAPGAPLRRWLRTQGYTHVARMPPSKLPPASLRGPIAPATKRKAAGNAP